MTYVILCCGVTKISTYHWTYLFFFYLNSSRYYTDNKSLVCIFSLYLINFSKMDYCHFIMILFPNNDKFYNYFSFNSLTLFFNENKNKFIRRILGNYSVLEYGCCQVHLRWIFLTHFHYLYLYVYNRFFKRVFLLLLI